MKSAFLMFILICILIISVMTIFCLVRAIIGPRLVDRIMAINMIGTMTIAIIMLMSVFLGETNVLDVALIYAVISFVAVIVLTQIYIGVFHHEKAYKEKRASADNMAKELSDNDTKDKEETTV